jgi:hypothetical protein
MLDLVRLEIVPILMQNRCMVCVPQAHKLFLTHLMELLDDLGLVESHLCLFGDSPNVSAR